MLLRDYHLFIYDTAGRQLGHLIGPIPQIGSEIEVEIEPEVMQDLVVARVKFHGGRISAADAPTVTTVSVYCHIAKDETQVLSAVQLDAPVLLRHGAPFITNRKAALGHND